MLIYEEYGRLCMWQFFYGCDNSLNWPWKTMTFAHYCMLSVERKWSTSTLKSLAQSQLSAWLNITGVLSKQTWPSSQRRLTCATETLHQPLLFVLTHESAVRRVKAKRRANSSIKRLIIPAWGKQTFLHNTNTPHITPRQQVKRSTMSNSGVGKSWFLLFKPVNTQ